MLLHGFRELELYEIDTEDSTCYNWIQETAG
jgi:hypothetical protein